MAEWLRRRTANPLGSARVGSNPILVEFFFFFRSNITWCKLTDNDKNKHKIPFDIFSFKVSLGKVQVIKILKNISVHILAANESTETQL